MPDWPGIAHEIPHVSLNTIGPYSIIGQSVAVLGTAGGGGGTWPAANRAIFVPVQTDIPVTIVKMAFQVVTQSGNFDIGIYDEHGNQIVSLGSTAVPVAGIAIADIADTVLMPGVYFLALNVDNTTASISRVLPAAAVCQMAGVQQQAVGAVTLPAPTATFANPASAYVPIVIAMTVPTI